MLPLSLETDEDFSEWCAEEHTIFQKEIKWQEFHREHDIEQFQDAKISHGTAKPTQSTMMSPAWHAGDTTTIILQRHEIGQVR